MALLRWGWGPGAASAAHRGEVEPGAQAVQPQYPYWSIWLSNSLMIDYLYDGHHIMMATLPAAKNRVAVDHVGSYCMLMMWVMSENNHEQQQAVLAVVHRAL